MPSAPQQRASCWLFKQNPKKILCHRSFWDLIFNLSLSYIVLKYLSFLSVVWDTARSKLINDICSPMESCCICDQKQEVDEITTFKKIGKGHANCTRRTKGNVVTFLGIVIMQIKVSKMKQRNKPWCPKQSLMLCIERHKDPIFIYLCSTLGFFWMECALEQPGKQNSASYSIRGKDVMKSLRE